MKTSRSIVVAVNVVAMLFMVSYPGGAFAAPTHHSKSKPKVKGTAQIKGKALTQSHSQSGLVDSTKNGLGDYTVTRTTIPDGVVLTRITDYANGTLVTSTDVITNNANGSKTSDITTNTNGKTTITDETIAANGAITGTIVQANGKVDEVSGDKVKTAYGSDTTLTLTNANGKTETLNDETLKISDAVANVWTGVGFNGSAINNASVQTTNTAPNTNAVDTTVNGGGSYTEGLTNGTLNQIRTFANGATSSSSNTITNNANGTTSFNQVGTSVTSTGVQSASDLQTTYTSTGNGANSIAGTFTQSNDHNGTVAGTESQTNYGFTTALTYTDQNGLTKTAQTESLVVGDTILNVNTGTTFTGSSNDSVGLVTGQASNYVGLTHPGSN